VPALSGRKEDIPLLFRKFAADVAVQYKMPAIQLDDEARTMLQNYYWRGNVRQLKNVAERISALEESRTITAGVLSRYLTPQHSSAPAMHGGTMGGEEFATERELLYKILFDMRSDINDLKRMMADLHSGYSSYRTTNPSPAEHSEVKALLPHAAPMPMEEYADSEIVDEEPREMTKADMQREQIVKALRRNGGSRRAAAAELFMSERTLYRKIKELNIEE
jgi:DNA-binding NtrC family response regulator